MNPQKDDKRLDELIARAADLGKVEFDGEKWLSRLASGESGRTKAEPHRKIWRTIMDSKVTRYSVAATILVVASLVLFDPFGPLGGRQGVVLAEVVERMNEVQTLTHKEKRVYYEVGKDEPMLKTNVVKYLSFDHGVVEEQYSEAGDLMYRVYILKDPAKIIILLIEQKKYFEMPLTDPWARLMNNLTPKAIVEHFKSGDCKDLGHAQVDGHDVEGFETHNTEIFPVPEQYRFLFPIRDIKWQFWIDKDLPFPVAADLEVTTGRGLFTLFKELRITCHDYDMVYDSNIPSTVFDPNIPADYTPLSLESAIKENAAWIGVGSLPILGIIACRGRRRTRLHEREPR